MMEEVRCRETKTITKTKTGGDVNGFEYFCKMNWNKI